MSKPSTTRRTHQPGVPRVSAETWRALVATADEFNRLAPWEWMHDSHVIGLRHPVTQEVLLGSILGRLRQVFALLVYRNDTRGTCSGIGRDRALITRIFGGTQLCRGDIAESADLVAGFTGGSCAMGDFVPYTAGS